jgi:hypothetical protein
VPASHRHLSVVLEVKADPKHEYRDWLGEHADTFDPEAFDVDAVNRRISSEAETNSGNMSDDDYSELHRLFTILGVERPSTMEEAANAADLRHRPDVRPHGTVDS